MLRACSLALLLAVAGVASAGERWATLHVADLAAMRSRPDVSIFDVNVESTRTYVGIIPGAELLDDTDEDLRRLPPDKSRMLVFYCANTYCSASDEAAERALAAGYPHVAVLVDGIYGWRKAGEPVRKIPAEPAAMKPARVLAMQQRHEAVIVDVREGEERHEVIDGASWMPMSQVHDAKVWAAFVKALPRDKTIILHCAVGVRSKRVAEMLRAEGLRAAYFKGPDEWRAAGLPVKRGPAP